MALSLGGNSANIGNSDYLLDPVHPVYFLILLGENYLSFNRNGETSIELHGRFIMMRILRRCL